MFPFTAAKAAGWVTSTPVEIGPRPAQSHPFGATSRQKQYMIKETYIQYGVPSRIAEILDAMELPVSTFKSTSNKTLESKFQLSLVDIRLVKSRIKRKPIDKQILNKLLYNSAYICCCCQNPEYGFIVHHIEEYSNSQDNNYSNLVVLCPNHHDQAHKKSGLTFSLKPSQLKEAKLRWEKLVKENREIKSKCDQLAHGISPDSVFETENTFNVCILKFADLESSIIDRTEHVIYRRLLQKADVESLDINVELVENINCPNSFKEAEAIGRKVNATLVIWGESYKDSKQLELFYTIVDQSEIHIDKNGSSGIGVVTNLADLKNGKLQNDIDFVIYWITLLKAFNNANHIQILNISELIINGLNVENALVYNILGQTQYVLGEFEKSILSFEKCLELGGNSLPLYNNIGLTYFSNENYDAAEEFYLKGFSIDQNSPLLLGNYGLLKLATGQFEEAVLYLKLGLSFDLTNLKMLNTLAQVYYETNQIDKFKEIFEYAFTLDKTNPDLNNTYSLFLIDEENYEEAERLLHSSTEAKPQSHVFKNNYGLVLSKLGKFDEAFANYTSSISIKPSYLSPYLNLAQLLFDNDRYEDVIVLYESIFEVFDLPDTVLGLAGDSYGLIGELQEAIKVYNRFTDKDNLRNLSIFYLASYYFYLDEYDTALPYLLRLLDEDGEDAAANYYLGSIYLARQDIELAEDHLIKSLNSESEVYLIHMKLAEFYFKRNMLDKCKDHYQTACAIDETSRSDVLNEKYGVGK